jgi:hypothetical protein
MGQVYFEYTVRVCVEDVEMSGAVYDDVVWSGWGSGDEGRFDASRGVSVVR